MTVLGRKDHMIITAGENVHPAQVEAVINQHPKVADSLVVGVPDAVKGSVLAAYVVPADRSLTVDELRAYLPGISPSSSAPGSTSSSTRCR